MNPRIPHPWHTGEYPYDVFEGTPISPAASHDEVLEASLELQCQERLQAEQRPAFDELRTIHNRLAIDFFLFEPALVDPVACARRILDGDWPFLDRADRHTS